MKRAREGKIFKVRHEMQRGHEDKGRKKRIQVRGRR